jgi:hypothetical protein
VRPRRSTFPEVSALVAIASLLVAPRAQGQACCAGSSAITPGRLQVPEDALVGVQLRAATILGAHDAEGRYRSSPSGNKELDFEEDFLGTLRILPRAQLTALVPFVETRRTAPPRLTDTGGGIGDVNLSARYDFVLAGESLRIPGIAVLVGATLPTGRPPESAGENHPLAADATGIGALQGSIGLALEQTFGPIVVNLSGILTQRAARTANEIRTRLGTQGTLLAAVGYTFENEAALAFVGTYTVEGNARIDDRVIDGSGRRVTTFTLSGLYPIDDRWRLQGGLYTNPPISQLGKNQPAALGATFTILRAWS